jgi:hypothetical protein
MKHWMVHGGIINNTSMNGATWHDCTTTTFHCVGIRDPNNSHDSCGVDRVHEIRGRNDNSRHLVHGIRERNDTSGVRSTESVNATRVLALSTEFARGRNASSGFRSTESVYISPGPKAESGVASTDWRKIPINQISNENAPLVQNEWRFLHVIVLNTVFTILHV